MKLKTPVTLLFLSLSLGGWLPDIHARMIVEKPISKTSASKAAPINPKSLNGIVMDDSQGERKGPWVEVNAPQVGHIGGGFLHDNNANKGEVSIVYIPEILQAGDYRIILISPPNTNRARSVPVTIAVKDTAKVNLFVDQRSKANNGLTTMGTFRLPKGKLTTVTVSNANTAGCVVADGIQFVPVKKRNLRVQNK